MTTPTERARAQLEATRLLQALRNAELTPGVPEDLRRHAETVLRHLASPGEVKDQLEMALRLFHAERERDELRKSWERVTWRVLLRTTIVFCLVLLFGMWVGTKAPH